MPYCCTKTTTWVQRLRVGMENREYTVQLDRQIGCCCEAYGLYINNQEIPVNHKLTYNPFSPLCCSGGQFEFERDGHTFLLMYNSYSWTKKFGEFRLFIDGVDANSGMEYSAFWRRRGLQIIFLGAFLLSIGIVLSVIFFFLLPPSLSTLQMGRIICPAVAVVAVLYFLMGVTVSLRQRRPKKSNAAAIDLPYTSV